MNDRLAGKVAVVTGASKGIGAEIAKTLAAAGASVVVNYRSSPDGAAAVIDEIVGAGGRAIAVEGDVAREEDMAHLFGEASRAYGPLDVLVNNAGIYRFMPFEQTTAEEFHRQFDTNVLGIFNATKAALDHFGPEGGSVINISSTAGSGAAPTSSIYSATKAAVEAVTRVCAQEFGSRGIRVNAIKAGSVRTEGADKFGEAEQEYVRQMVARTPLGRQGDPADIALVVLFLASSESRWITGESLVASGGYR